MKRISSLMIATVCSVISVNAQTVFINGGTSGIGTTSPAGNTGVGVYTNTPLSNYFDVTGDVRLNGAAGNADDGVKFASPNAEKGFSIFKSGTGNRADVRYDGTALKLVCATGTGVPAATNGISISNDGRLGVGIVAPGKRVDVNALVSNDAIRAAQAGSGYIGLELNNQTTNGRYWGILSLGNGNSQGSGNLLVYNFTSSRNDLMIEGSTGNTVLGGTNAFGYKLYVNGSVFSTGVYDGSDRRLKENIRNVDGAMQIIKQLQGVRYTFRQDLYMPNSKDEFGNLIKRDLPQGLQLGLIAQDVEKVLPEIVATDNEGYKAIAYQKIVAVLIEGMKEQQATIEAKSIKTQELEQRISHLEQLLSSVGTGINNTIDLNGGNDVLLQNVPNPFNGNTEIQYKLPANSVDAYVVIVDINGKTTKKINLQGTEGSASVSANDMAAGVYLYSLWADGKELATKRMVVSK